MPLADLVSSSFRLSQTPTCTDKKHHEISFSSSSQPNKLLISTNNKATMKYFNIWAGTGFRGRRWGKGLLGSMGWLQTTLTIASFELNMTASSALRWLSSRRFDSHRCGFNKAGFEMER
ncbi:hypothetical protein L484_020460 [Morus notabilis]|uniref:Uncharacterized protein n=1 Tax=Morus notabilis TaxID=981085 RepID=W9SBJ6_9ROSA|nr:hypothetical protein L484_020460 [Morus notabilis]